MCLALTARAISIKYPFDDSNVQWGDNWEDVMTPLDEMHVQYTAADPEWYDLVSTGTEEAILPPVKNGKNAFVASGTEAGAEIHPSTQKAWDMWGKYRWNDTKFKHYPDHENYTFDAPDGYKEHVNWLPVDMPVMDEAAKNESLKKILEEGKALSKISQHTNETNDDGENKTKNGTCHGTIVIKANFTGEDTEYNTTAEPIVTIKDHCPKPPDYKPLKPESNTTTIGAADDLMRHTEHFSTAQALHNQDVLYNTI